MVDCSVGLHDTEMGPARLSAVTPAAIDVAVGSGASKKQGRGTRPTSQTQRAEDRIASRARPGVPDRSFCTRGGIPSVIKLVPNKHRNAGGRIRPARKSKHVRIHGCRIDAPCELRRTRRPQVRSAVGLALPLASRIRDRERDHTVQHRARARHAMADADLGAVSGSCMAWLRSCSAHMAPHPTATRLPNTRATRRSTHCNGRS